MSESLLDHFGCFGSSSSRAFRGSIFCLQYPSYFTEISTVGKYAVGFCELIERNFPNSKSESQSIMIRRFLKSRYFKRSKKLQEFFNSNLLGKFYSRYIYTSSECFGKRYGPSISKGIVFRLIRISLTCLVGNRSIQDSIREFSSLLKSQEIGKRFDGRSDLSRGKYTIYLPSFTLIRAPPNHNPWCMCSTINNEYSIISNISLS